MSVTPHGWHIPGSLMPDDYDESKLAYRCGGVNHCTDCHLAFAEWLNNEVSRGAMSPNQVRTLLGLDPFTKSNTIRGMTPHFSIIDELSDNPSVESWIPPIPRPSAHYVIMGDGTVHDTTTGAILTKHANSTSAVEHPKHYNMYEGVEVIDLTEQMNNNRGNVVKYVARAEFKGNELQDLEKGLFYLKREIRRVKRKQKKEAKKQIRYVGNTDSLGMPVNRYSGNKG